MRQVILRCRPLGPLAVLVVLAGLDPASPARAQGPAPVRYTVAVSHEVRSRVTLPGTVESPTSSLVASEVAGLVVVKRVREGQMVAAGDPLVDLRTDMLELQQASAQAQLAEAEARLVRAEQAYERAKNLSARELVSDDEYDESFADYQAWTARVEQWKAEIGRIELDLKRCHIRAPLAGMIVAEQTDVGEWLGVGQPVVEILSLHDLEVRVEVAEHFFAKLSVGVAADVELAALPGLELEGVVRALIAKADARSRTFPILVTISNPERRIAPGMLAEVSLPLGSPGEAVLVPKDAIVRQGPAEQVWIIGDDDTVQSVTVQSGDGHGAWVIIEEGVEAGQRVVTRGNERLRPGVAVLAEPLDYDLP